MHEIIMTDIKIRLNTFLGSTIGRSEIEGGGGVYISDPINIDVIRDAFTAQSRPLEHPDIIGEVSTLFLFISIFYLLSL